MTAAPLAHLPCEAPRRGRALPGEVSPRSARGGSPFLPHCKCGDSPSEVWLFGLRSGVRSIRGVESGGRPEPPRAAAGLGIKLGSGRSRERAAVPAGSGAGSGDGTERIARATSSAGRETGAGGLGWKSLDSGELSFFPPLLPLKHFTYANTPEQLSGIPRMKFLSSEPSAPSPPPARAEGCFTGGFELLPALIVPQRSSCKILFPFLNVAKLLSL